jgi:hypothetical protein
MICKNCATRDHVTCVDRNKDKVPADCDCAHRAPRKIGIPNATQGISRGKVQSPNS